MKLETVCQVHSRQDLINALFLVQHGSIALVSQIKFGWDKLNSAGTQISTEVCLRMKSLSMVLNLKAPSY